MSIFPQSEVQARQVCADPVSLTWFASRIELEAWGPPQRAHPLSVFEAIIKGAREAAGLNAPLLWHWPGQGVEHMAYQKGQRIALELQFFGAGLADAQRLSDTLEARMTHASTQRNFTWLGQTPWQLECAPELPPSAAYRLEFHTPLSLPKKRGMDHTAISQEEFLYACHKRIGKLWGQEICLPPPPDLLPQAWRYWRTTHRSRSQQGEPLLLNGCLGQLCLTGPQLDAWRPWLALLAKIGLGDRLGFSLGRFTLLAEPLLEMAPAHNTEHTSRCRPLYIERSGSRLSLDNDNIVLEGGEQDTPKEKWPLCLLESVQCSVPVQITSPLLHALGEQGVPLVLSGAGRQPLLLVSAQSESRHHRHLVAHHAAHASLDEAAQVHLAAAWVLAKISAHEQLVRSRYAAGDNHLLNEWLRVRNGLAECRTLDAVRGWEGLAARHYYPWLAQHHPELGAWRGRIGHKGTPDALNALLNYGYSLLRNRVEMALRAHGLDPYLGILHAANGRHPALVSDFMEPLRACVDKLVLRLLGLRQIGIEHLEESVYGIRITAAGRRTFMRSFGELAHQAKRGGLLQRIETMTRSYHQAVQERTLARWFPPMEEPLEHDDNL